MHSRIIISTILISTCIAVVVCKRNDPEPDPGNGQVIITPDSPVTDFDGNVYKTVKIGNQIWMAENLRTTRFRNGDAIPEVTGNSAWFALQTAANCTYENTKNNVDIATNGRLYNWYATNDARQIAPAGWHVPTEADWATLINYLGGENSAGGKMKETGTTHWNAPNTGATNQSGFTALSSGVRDGNVASGDRNFFNKGNGCYLWIAGSGVQYINISFDSAATISAMDVYKQDGFSIRCIKD